MKATGVFNAVDGLCLLRMVALAAVGTIWGVSALAPPRHGIPAYPLEARTRRGVFQQGAVGLAGFASLVVPTIVTLDRSPSPAWAAEDCYQDCYKNCLAIAPLNSDYCDLNCREYCAQPNRSDGLSGSASYEGGEVGILGGTFGTGTVVKGQDKPPSVSIPGLDFTSPEGKKLIGY